MPTTDDYDAHDADWLRHQLRQRDRETGIDGRQRGAHQLRDRVHAEIAAHIDAKERKALLRPRPVEFYIIGLRDLARAHVANDADNGCDG